ncbi:hypothetical protein BHM03_00048442, partial [Ensete ventricosum]
NRRGWSASTGQAPPSLPPPRSAASPPSLLLVLLERFLGLRSATIGRGALLLTIETLLPLLNDPLPPPSPAARFGRRGGKGRELTDGNARAPSRRVNLRTQSTGKGRISLLLTDETLFPPLRGLPHPPSFARGSFLWKTEGKTVRCGLTDSHSSNARMNRSARVDRFVDYNNRLAPASKMNRSARTNRFDPFPGSERLANDPF